MKIRLFSGIAGASLASMLAACAADAPRAVRPTPATGAARPTPPVPASVAAPVIEPPAAAITDASAPEPAPVAMADLVVSDAGAALGGGRVLGSPCVNPSVHAAVVSASDSGSEPMPDFFVEDPTAKLDLDRDTKDDVVINGGASRWDVTYWLYVRRGACGHFVGTLSSSDGVKALRSASGGLVDLRVVTDECPKRGGVGHGWCEIVYRFDGTRYKPISERRAARPGGSIP